MAGYTLTGAGCRDSQGQFVPVSQCTGRRRKAKSQKSLGGTSGMKMKKGSCKCIRIKGSTKGRKLCRLMNGKVRYRKGQCAPGRRVAR